MKLRIRALLAPRRLERELDEELAFHVECETQKHIAKGLSPAEARTKALARFGSVPLAADRCRDARGTSFVDSAIRDILYAFRTFRRAPLAAATIVATVALGLGLITVVFTFYNAFFLQAAALRNPGELFVVERPPHPGAGRVWITFTRPEYEALRRETNVFTDVSGMSNDAILSRIDGRPVGGTFVTGNFFEVLGVNASLGRVLTPADDERFAGRPVIVLSHRGWNRLFAEDPAVIGRSVPVNGAPHEIVGVMPPAFQGLGVTPDYWAPLALVEQLPKYRGREADLAIPRVVGRLKPGISRETATAGLTVWASGRTDLRTATGHPAYIRLRAVGELSPDVVEGLKSFAPIFFAFGLILMIGCANVANLLLARGVSRQREIGIRLSLGASRRRIVRQLLTESLLLALVSALCAFAISRAFVETAIRVLVRTVPAEYAGLVSLGAPDADWRVLVFLLGGAIVSTVFFGLMPALQATRLELVRTMRGELTKDSRPSRARHVLIAVQVGASALLLICAGVFLRSAFAAASVGPGLRTSDTVMVDFANEPLRGALLQAVSAHPSVAAVVASSPGPMGFLKPATAESGSRQAVVAYQFVSPGYFTLLDIDLLRGRGFTAAERTTEAGVVVVSERAARELWPDRDALGQVVRLRVEDPAAAPDAPRPPARAYTVIGVAPAVGAPIRTLSMDFASADVYLPINSETPGTSLTLRVHGDPEQARHALLADLTKVDPALGSITTMRTMAAMDAYILKVAFWVTLVLGGLALLLTLSGLFGVLSYLVEQRRQEIGVRMALGATTGDVATLVLSQSVRPVGVGLVAGGGLAGAAAIALMSTPAASRVGGLVHVFDPAAYVVSFVIILTACLVAASLPALRAARIDPIATLRED